MSVATCLPQNLAATFLRKHFCDKYDNAMAIAAIAYTKSLS
jgi:hypothetical protein